MNDAVILVLIVGFFVLVIGLLLYSVLIDQPRLRRKFQEQSQQRGWTYTAGKSLIVTRRSSSGYLVSPQETIAQSFEGKEQGINWRVDQVAVARKYVQPVTNAAHRDDSMGSNQSHHTVWHTDDVRIEHGSVLLFVKPTGWTPGENVSGMLKAGLQSVRSSLLDSILRMNWGIQSTPVTLDAPALEAKYRIEVSDLGAAKGSLTPEVRDFLVNQRPPNSLIHLGDNGLHVVVSEGIYARNFEKIVGLVEYGVQLANVVAASQSAATPVEPLNLTDSPTL
ncbi:MAG: hypothetical protein ABI835_12670 [Chloroflexota bacterium]